MNITFHYIYENMNLATIEAIKKEVPFAPDGVYESLERPFTPNEGPPAPVNVTVSFDVDQEVIDYLREHRDLGVFKDLCGGYLTHITIKRHHPRASVFQYHIQDDSYLIPALTILEWLGSTAWIEQEYAKRWGVHSGFVEGGMVEANILDNQDRIIGDYFLEYDSCSAFVRFPESLTKTPLPLVGILLEAAQERYGYPGVEKVDYELENHKIQEIEITGLPTHQAFGDVASFTCILYHLLERFVVVSRVMGFEGVTKNG